MRILSLLTCCMAGAMSLSATGKAGQSTAPVAPMNVQAKNVEAQTAPAQDVLAENPAIQALPAQTAPKQKAPAQSAPGRQNAPAEVTPRGRAFPHAQFDTGIYAGRNGFTGAPVCLAIQSYNFSKSQAPGKVPELESVTTCTSVTKPLMQQVGKPQLRNLQMQNQQEQVPPEQGQPEEKDPK